MQSVAESFLFSEVREDIILDQLLGDRTGTALRAVSCENTVSGTHDTFDVNAVVLIKALVLDRHKGVLHIFRNLFQFFVDAIRTRRDKFAEFLTVFRIDKGSKACRGNVLRSDLRGICNDTAVQADPVKGARRNSCENDHHKEPEEMCQHFAAGHTGFR